MKKIIWEEEAIQTYIQNIDYLEREWDEKAMRNFTGKVENMLITISESPEIHPNYNKKNKIHKCIIAKAITLYYQIKDEEISLLTFWNNYQNPKKLKI